MSYQSYSNANQSPQTVIKVVITGPYEKFADTLINKLGSISQLSETTDVSIPQFNFSFLGDRYIFFVNSLPRTLDNTVFLIFYDVALPNQLPLVNKELQELRGSYPDRPILLISVGTEDVALSPVSTYLLGYDAFNFSSRDIRYNNGGMISTVGYLLERIKDANDHGIGYIGDLDDSPTGAINEIKLLMDRSFTLLGGRYLS